MSETAPGIYEPGTVIDDKLRVERVLGEGGMGVVYEVTHVMTHHRRALKLLHAQLGRQQINVERFLREASAAGKIGNPHIVETFDAGRLSTGEPFLLMELLEGESLAARLAAQERMTLSGVADLFAQLCAGVHAAHEAGIVHRDLKPENVFLCTNDDGPFVKILDFGVSKFDERHTAVEQKTQTGATIGTPGYMSLEQIDDSAEVDERSDVYALGVMLYEMLVGEHPYPASSFLQLAKKVAAGTFTPPSEAKPGLPDALDALMAELLTPDREARIASANEVAERLAAISAAQAEEVPIAHEAEAPNHEEQISGFDDTVAMDEPKTMPQAPAELESEKRSVGLWVALGVGAVGIVVATQTPPGDAPKQAREGLSSALPTPSLLFSAMSSAPAVSADGTASPGPSMAPSPGPLPASSPSSVPVSPRPPPVVEDPDLPGKDDEL